MNRKNRKCPYCKSKVSYFGALSELQSGEHTCRNCCKNSNIAFNKMIYIPAAAALLLAIIVAAMFFLFKIIHNLILALVLILVPFGVFYFLTPLFYKLEEITNEAQTPVMMFEPKRAARAERQSRTLKSDEVAKAETSKLEQKSKEKKKKTGGGKFSQFVRTYIIVPDDDEEIETKLEPKNPEPEIEDTISQKQSSEIIAEKQNEPQQISEPPDEAFVDIESGDVVRHDKPAEVEEKPKLNFNKLFSKLNFSDNKNKDLKADENIQADNSVNPDESVNVGGPVYHRLTKTNKVNFVYYPETKAFISVDLTEKEPEVVPYETNIEIGEEESNAAAEAIELVVEKAVEAEKEEEENREIVNFFADKASEELENSAENVEEINEDVPNENIQEEITDDDWVDYVPETRDFITLKFDEPNDKNKFSDNNIISLSDVNFDIPESEDFKQESDFIDYDSEDKFPVIVVEDSLEKLAEIDKINFEKNPKKFEWNFFSSEKVDLNPEIINFDNNNLINPVVDDEVDYKEEFEIFSQTVTENDEKKESVSGNIEASAAEDSEEKEKSKFGFVSKYVSKIKNESVFNFGKNKLSNNVDEPTETPDEILEFKEDLPEEVKVDEVIEFDTDIDSDSEVNEAAIIINGNYPENDDNIVNKYELNTEEVVEPAVDKVSLQEETDDNTLNDEVSEEENIVDMDYESVESDSVDVELESTDISENESEYDEIEIFKPEEFMYLDFSERKRVVADEPLNVEEKDSLEEEIVSEKDDEYFKFNEDDDETSEEEIVTEEDDEYYKFNEDDDETSEEEIVTDEDDEYYKFNEDDDETPEEEIVTEEDDEYYKFDEEDDETSDEEIVTEEDDEYYKFDEDDDETPEQEFVSQDNDEYNEFDEETIEGAIEYIPEEENSDNFVVDYSDEENDSFEDISSGEQLDENFNLDEFRAMGSEKQNDEEKADEEPVVPIKIDSSGNKIEEPEQPSRYEKKFPNAAKAAAEQAAALEIKKHREQQKAKAAAKAKKNKLSSSENVKKNSQKPKDGAKKTSQKSKDSVEKDSLKTKTSPGNQEQKTGFFSGLKNKIIEATEEERQAAFEEEERARKLAEKEARRKAKEKEKEKAEKLKAHEEKDKIKAGAGVNTAKDNYRNLENKAKADAEERKKKSQKTKRIEKNKVKIPSDIPADGKTIVFDGSEKEYEVQEKIVLDSVKDKVRELENKKVTEAEKVKIISEKVDEEKRQEKIEKLKSEQEEQRVRKEKKRRENQLRSERLEKAEEIRREQVNRVRKDQNERKKSEQKRDAGSVSLKEVGNVRSKVSQKHKKRKQEIDEVL